MSPLRRRLTASLPLAGILLALAGTPGAAQETRTPLPAGLVPPPGTAPAATANPANWPRAHSAGLIDARTEQFVTQLMARMSVREKVGQLIQGDIGSVKPEDLRQYPLGSILGGGNSPPLSGDQRDSREEWVRTARAYRAVSLEKRTGHEPIPIIFGMDSIHGNSNVVGAVIFPHNIGLGAMRDPALIRRIGRVAAVESAAAGFDWAFAPTVAVPQDDRWGRAYEGYAERPEIVRDYAREMVLGMQGEPGKGRIQYGNVAASIKHFVGDGATRDGIDQGDARISERELIDTHAQGYVSAIDAGAMTAMLSFSSWNGAKNSANKSLVTGVLKGRFGFDGLVVSDWNSHGQVPGCSNGDCPAAFNAGLDMAMVPDDWKALFDNTLREVEAGTIPMARVDDAVRRILRIKARLGLFDPARPYEDRGDLLAAPEHRAIAREAVAKSMVLLKNNGSVLPIKPGARVLVTGSHADDIGLQSGGWTLSWQGTGNTNKDFPNGTSIWAGLKDAIAAAGGSAELSADGKFVQKPDVAIVVFGELPYAELVGDITTLEFQPGDKQALAQLKALKAAGIPTVSVFLSGRPLWVNPELNQSDAFVAAFLPGSEGAGVADVLVAARDGKPKRDFTGKLSFSWPKTAAQFALNAGKQPYDPLYAYGYGLNYAARGTQGAYGEESGVDPAVANISVYFARGKEASPWRFATQGAVQMRAVDSATTQEGARRFDFAGAGQVRMEGPVIDLARQANANLALLIDYRIDRAASAPVMLKLGNGAGVPFAGAGTAGGWKTAKIALRCFATAGSDLGKTSPPFAMTASDGAISIATLRLETDPEGASCTP